MNSTTLNTNHLFNLTDNVGIYQHSKYSVPNLKEGYTTDDNARALIVAVALYENYKDKKYLDLIYRYMSFLLHAQNENGKFRNFMDYERNFKDKEGTEDCFGRAIWAIGYTLADKNIPSGIKNTCGHMMIRALPDIRDLKYVRGMAYTLIGLSYVDLYIKESTVDNNNENMGEVFSIKTWEIKELMKLLADRLVDKYKQNKDEGWYWYEDIVTYGNSVFPWALFEAYNIFEEEKYLNVAQESLKFLEDIYFRKGYFKPVGCKGWYKKGSKPADFDEQPIEASETALMYFNAFKIFNDKYFLNMGIQTFNWYHGENSLKVKLIDEDTGGCYDGITENGINLNEGAESLLSYLMVALEKDKVQNLQRAWQ